MLLTLFTLSLSLFGVHAGYQCMSGLPDSANLTSMAVEIITNTSHGVMYSTQLILTSVEFNCTGAITGWTTLAMNGTGKGRVEMSVWSPVENSRYTKKAGYLMDACSGPEEIIHGTGIHLHQGRTTDLTLQFQPGDVLGLLLRLEKSSNYAPLLIEEDHNTGFTYTRNGQYENSFTLSPGTSTNKSPLFSLELCIENPDSDEMLDYYPNCSTIIVPDDPCPTMEPIPSSSSLPPSVIPSIIPTSPSDSSYSSSSLPTPILIVVIAIPCVLMMLVIVLSLCVIIWCVQSKKKKKKIDLTSSQQSQRPSTLPNLSYDTPFPITNGDPTTHTYETPLDRPRPSVTISCDTASSGDAVIVNHTRSGSHAEASIYEEPLVSVPQYDSILGAQHQHVYDALTNSDPSHPPVFSRHNSPHLLPSLAPYSNTTTTTTTPYYHTLEKSQRSPSPSPPQNRANRHSGKPLSPLVTRARGATASDETATVMITQTSAEHSEDSKLSPGYQIITSNSNLKLNSGIYVPTHQQRSLFSHEPIFDDSIYADLRNAPNSPLAHNWSFFVETDHYWKPASDKKQLYHQLHTNKFREINRKQIEIVKHLGSGEFGTVCKGFWHTNSGSLEVAIKMVQNQVSEIDKVRFLQESATLGQFQHPNIVRLHGVVTVSDPVMILLELMKKGDLKDYLQTLQPVPGELVQPELQSKLLRFCSEVALGLEYLAKKRFVHRDISARNILLTEDYTCKIADFGMSRDLDTQDYYLANGGMIPFKWTAPEALHYRKYSSASDVWSYGILLWEIWSLGQTPYKNCNTPGEATALINSGARLPPPPGCSRAIYKLMMECWNPKPSSRPTFTDIVKTLHVPSSQLLYWNEEDESSHDQATCLGANMEAGHCLYTDLQVMYSKISV